MTPDDDDHPEEPRMTVLDESTPGTLATAVAALADGGTVVVPSRTNYALICDAEDPDAIDRVYEAKERTKFGPLTLAVPTIDDVARYVRLLPDFGLAELHQVWPSEVSFIYQLDHPLPPRMTMGAGTVAVMFHPPCALRRLLHVYGRSVALTSANLSGQGNIVVTREKAIEDVSDRVDVVVVNDRHDEVVDVDGLGLNPSNTIVDLSFSPPFLVRDGAHPPVRLLRWLPSLVLDTAAYQDALRARIGAGAT
jgi:L-threonylcarbamoyladenylate synthase